MGSFAALTTLYLHACQELTYVFKSSMLESVSNLKELQIDDCENMKTIISTDHGVSECGSISLTSLTLDDLPELVSIWDGTDQTKLLFENITVYDCPQLKQMTIDSELEQTLKKISGEQDWWEWEENELRSKFEAIFNPIKEGDVHTS
ncbi:disease resistance protein RPS2-like protein [Corchorus capsularis]|uniref:Disease resistance protein RPS2-like protein n=1 Tax=Corchorus capsularis TaxID=210143 RepID=A0A1R3JXG9_COCAP|nr:disease resistance protein RPS2-like protein [Corchorus capsularis]